MAHFFNLNKSSLLTYAVAWGLILCSIGMLHGYESTTIPFSIGMGAGMGLGLLGGAICAYVFQIKNSVGGRITKRANNDLDFTTRNIALTVFVTIYLTATTRMPPGMGLITGALMGDHLAIMVYWGIGDPRSIEERVRALEAEKEGNDGSA